MQEIESREVSDVVVIDWLDQEDPALVDVMTTGVEESAPLDPQSVEVPLTTHDTESRLDTPDGTTGVEFHE